MCNNSNVVRRSHTFPLFTAISVPTLDPSFSLFFVLIRLLTLSFSILLHYPNHLFCFVPYPRPFRAFSLNFRSFHDLLLVTFLATENYLVLSIHARPFYENDQPEQASKYDYFCSSVLFPQYSLRECGGICECEFQLTYLLQKLSQSMSWVYLKNHIKAIVESSLVNLCTCKSNTVALYTVGVNLRFDTEYYRESPNSYFLCA